MLFHSKNGDGGLGRKSDFFKAGDLCLNSVSLVELVEIGPARINLRLEKRAD